MCSEKACKGYDSQKNMQGGELALQHFARDNEGQELQDSH